EDFVRAVRRLAERDDARVSDHFVEPGEVVEAVAGLGGREGDGVGADPLSARIRGSLRLYEWCQRQKGGVKAESASHDSLSKCSVSALGAERSTDPRSVATRIGGRPAAPTHARVTAGPATRKTAGRSTRGRSRSRSCATRRATATPRSSRGRSS